MGRGGAYVSSRRDSESEIHAANIGIYGWRKRCLYFLVLLLMVLIIINIALTVWILKVLDFSIYGFGSLKLSGDDVRISGDVEFLNPVYASEIHANHDLPLVLNSKNNITFNARNRQGNVTGKFVIGSKEVKSFSERFIIYDSQENILFDASDESLTIGDIVKHVKFTVSGGVAFQGPIQANIISSNNEENLRLESPIGDVTVNAAETLTLSSNKLESSCHGDMSLESKTGKIILESSNIHITGLQKSTTTAGAYQLCICENGRLFLAHPSEMCDSTNSECN
ncbi:zeta-sarcoglycan-like [Anneissia japonica]|uniref:zeta-sarcoglycan-like n=1 Tax=Anneissia japonica TaxID=1529436 RepID=UPI0014255928|nr:zeta-sarcoglycan-like [Anneissia japonica]